MQTGLRNTELCQLKLADVDLPNQRLSIYLGKGRKNRKVGISTGLVPILQEYLTYRRQRPVDSPYFWKWQYKSAPVLEQLTVKKYTTSPA